MSLLADVESSPEVGSSRRRSDGSTRISYPMLVLFLSPPDTPLTNAPPILVCRHLNHTIDDHNSFDQHAYYMKKKYNKFHANLVNKCSGD